MITPEQEKWLAHLPDDNRIEIFPYDPAVPEIFRQVKERITSKIGNGITVELHGAASLGISGQREIDVYVPVAAEGFATLLDALTGALGRPGSVYPLERARFVEHIGNTKIEIFLINEAHDGWINCLKFENYLRVNPGALEAYGKLKESGNGLSTREYYRRKNEFINDILAR